nr:hypothetical protein [Deltaproteobacteria bacterium]
MGSENSEELRAKSGGVPLRGAKRAEGQPACGGISARAEARNLNERRSEEHGAVERRRSVER